MEKKAASGYEGVVSWYMRVSKLAVAIIKIRPSEGARQFAESLADRLKQQDEGWRSKARNLYEDLLHLRQELLFMHLLFKTKINAGPGDVHGMLSECLLALGGSPVVRTSLVQPLMSQIIQLAQQLWDTCKRSREEQHHQMDWIRYENVFWLLEHFTQDNDYKVNQEHVIQLETKAFPLRDEFPLFSLYMWRIGGLFRAGHT